MAPKQTIKARALELHDTGLGQDEARAQLREEGYSKTGISLATQTWPPPQLTPREMAWSQKPRWADVEEDDPEFVARIRPAGAVLQGVPAATPLRRICMKRPAAAKRPPRRTAEA